ncbi:RidA family protein [Georgenia yuyongxinii]|uniref:RidA family protein n=1 Tax=Georgenia yuyongxinii TaxID=2589797 RepID=A0A552WYC4_9MICO|nr:RidA family protein [Georgenia yuyongxinii]TRW47619.1 RidA family protein [Georgenia yuyongxinii]
MSTPHHVRTAGQVPAIPGAVRAGSLVVTSGVVAPTALARLTDPGMAAVPVAQQVTEALETLLSTLAEAGASPADVIKVEAFLRDAKDLAVWDAEFVKVWPRPGPARTTVVLGLAAPTLAIELQATAVVGDDRPR